MLAKPYIIRGNNYAESCVVKVKYGNKYIIVKCKSLPQGMKNLENAVNAFIRGGANNPAGMYYHLINYVKTHPGNTFKVEMILESDNAYYLLKKEQEELDLGRGNENFLNNQLQAYIPAYDEEKQAYGWIPKSSVLHFRKYIKHRQKARKKPAASKKAAV